MSSYDARKKVSAHAAGVIVSMSHDHPCQHRQQARTTMSQLSTGSSYVVLVVLTKTNDVSNSYRVSARIVRNVMYGLQFLHIQGLLREPRLVLILLQPFTSYVITTHSSQILIRHFDWTSLVWIGYRCKQLYHGYLVDPLGLTNPTPSRSVLKKSCVPLWWQQTRRQLTHQEWLAGLPPSSKTD